MDQPRREALAELLLAWEDAFRAGRDMSAADLAGDRPELVEPLARHIRVLRATLWLDDPQDAPRGDASPSVPPPGGRLLGGRYRLDERIAVGGFAEVWRAFDTDLQRTVAVKIPKATRIAMQDAFLAEARRVARLRHPSIVSVHDVGIDGEECYIVSEFMDGGSLADRLADGPLDHAAAVRWVGHIADALAFAHQAGVIHRDVKPANILLNHHHDAVLADFGIAQSATKTGTFAPSMGTLRYMAPEQLAGKPTAPTADIYSLGIVLHEALTGRTPHEGDTPPAIHREVIGGRRLPLSPSLPPALAAVCRRAIERDPGRRHQTAAAFAAELRKASLSATPRGIRRPALIIVACIAAVTTGIGIRAWRPVPEQRQPATPTPLAASPIPAPHLVASAEGRGESLKFLRIEDSLRYVVAAHQVGVFREWQEPPTTYLGPLLNDHECSVTYRFDAVRPLAKVRLATASRCWDFTREPGGLGRGALALDVSSDGLEWLPLRDSIAGRQWGKNWIIDESLPPAVLGGRSLWIRVRFMTNGSPNAAYSVAQFGRSLDDPFQPTLSVAVELQPENTADSQAGDD